MSIQMIGIDHRKAGIDVRTEFSFTKHGAQEALEQLKQMQGIAGVVLLSTCNRMELYLDTSEKLNRPILELLCEVKGKEAKDYCRYFIERSGYDAVNHLFRLACGLESRILGEDQIVTQVGDAISLSRLCECTSPVLETLFRLAVTASKKVKSTIALTPSDNSVVRAAIDLLKEDGFNFQNKRGMVIGNGVMGKLAATLLQREGAKVTVTVRQYRSGMVEIPPHCARIHYGDRYDLFGDCDLVVSATVSPNYTLTRELVKQNQKHPMLLIDLAVPRDIEASVGELPGITLYDIDSFRQEAHSIEQLKAIKQAEKSYEEQIKEFYDWYECRDAVPRILELKEKTAEDLMLRIQKKLRQLPVTDELRTLLEQDIRKAAANTVNKMLFGLRDQVDQNTLQKTLAGLESIVEKPGWKH